jgi:hypothetical protein
MTVHLQTCPALTQDGLCRCPYGPDEAQLGATTAAGLHHAISMMVAAVYGDDTPPGWFLDRLNDVADAAAQEAATRALDALAKEVRTLPGINGRHDAIGGALEVERASVLALIKGAERCGTCGGPLDAQEHALAHPQHHPFEQAKGAE